ncbi:MAG: hypothetical protein ABR587_11845 [Candidatus Binatia bacterium]
MARSPGKILVIVGISLIALGVANTLAGNSKMNEWRARKQAAIAAGGESVRLPFSGTPSILDPSTDAQLFYESAAIKYEYYRIVRRGGHYFLGIGAAVLLFAAARNRWRRRRRAVESQPA